ncbi:unnamed protein product [Diamesa serratosioi]
MFNSEKAYDKPYCAYVTFTNTEMSFYGGGTLISSRHVLTNAANIVGFPSWSVGLGSHLRSSQMVYRSDKALPHPQYLEQNSLRNFDIGIITLNQAVTFSSLIYPVKLPTMNQMLEENTQGMVLGFAKAVSTGGSAGEELQSAHVRVTSSVRCLEFYPGADFAQHFCGEDKDFRSNFCLGDQGGSFTILERGIEVLMGIASLPSCSATQPSVYTRISSPLRQWIRDETQL